MIPHENQHHGLGVTDIAVVLWSGDVYNAPAETWVALTGGAIYIDRVAQADADIQIPYHSIMYVLHAEPKTEEANA